MFGDKFWNKLIGTMLTLIVLFAGLGWAFDRALRIAGY